MSEMSISVTQEELVLSVLGALETARSRMELATLPISFASKITELDWSFDDKQRLAEFF